MTTFAWRGRRVEWRRLGSGPPVVLCHGTPWSSWLWEPFAEALADRFTVHLWDMPGYGASSKDAAHGVGLDVQGELLADLVAAWELDGPPHVVAHDIGGAVALRAHLLHGVAFRSLALVDVVALRPWGSPFFRLAAEHEAVFAALPGALHEGLVRAYVSGASAAGPAPEALDALAAPWLGELGQAAFYRQIAQADERHTAAFEDRLGEVSAPALVVWGEDDAWIPVDRAHRLAASIPGAELALIPGAGHLVGLDRPAELAAVLDGWLTRQRGAAAG
jgi:pimeloyl-ACP methyl ester carboxylesterase